MPFRQRCEMGNERLRTAHSLHHWRSMKKDRVQKKSALELKLARIRQLSAKELGVAQGGRPTCDESGGGGDCHGNCSMSACNTGSCNDTN
jgi:hypothetical protein